MRFRLPIVVFAFLSATASLHAASFIVPNDRDLVHRADAIVVASPLASRTEVVEIRGIETITTFSIEEVISGTVRRETIEVREPGGTLGDRSTIIPGVPRFEDGERYALFLLRSSSGWHVLDLVLGKFRFATDIDGREILVRDEEEIAGWDADGRLHQERHRSAAGFLEFLRVEARGGMARQDYFVPKEPVNASFPTESTGPIATTNYVATVLATANSYTFTVSGSLGARWNVFPSAVTFYSIGTEPGAPGNGTTAINAAIAAWNNDPNSNVNYVYGGADNSGTHNGGLSTADGQNSIYFERDLSSFGVSRFQCSGNSYSGTLGLGGVTRAGGTHTGPNGESFATTLEGDVEMNQGLANCTLLFSNGDFNTAVAHEVGHTLGFRHSDQTRADNPSIACTTDASLECSNSAVMKSFIPNGINATLQPWDQHAVAAVYPGTGQTTLPAPTGVNARATASNQVLVTWNAVSGAASYQILRRDPGVALRQIGTSLSTSFTDNSVAANTAYLYTVRAVSSGGGTSPDSGADLATTVIFTDDPLTAGTIVRAVHLSQLRTAVNAVRALAGMSAYPFTDSASPGVVIKAVHVNELRSALDTAMGTLGQATGGYTNGIASGSLVRAVDFQEIRNRMK